MEIITFAGGCFWCTEAVFQRIKGVINVDSGYANSNIPDPTYTVVSSGNTGAAEAVQIKFNPKIISLNELLDVFFSTHDPTTKNRQGADIGTQYRSAVFYHDDNQKKKAEEYLKKIPNAVTEITKLVNFTKAEDFHKNYYNNNKTAAYCKIVIDPKLSILNKKYSSMLK